MDAKTQQPEPIVTCETCGARWNRHGTVHSCPAAPSGTTPLDVTPRNFLLDVAEKYWNEARETEADQTLDPEIREVLVGASRRRGNQARDWALTFPAQIGTFPAPSGATDTAAKIADVRGERSFACDVDDVRRRAAIRYPLEQSGPPSGAPETPSLTEESWESDVCNAADEFEAKRWFSTAKRLQALAVALPDLLRSRSENAGLRSRAERAERERDEVRDAWREIAADDKEHREAICRHLVNHDELSGKIASLERDLLTSQDYASVLRQANQTYEAALATTRAELSAAHARLSSFSDALDKLPRYRCGLDADAGAEMFLLDPERSGHGDYGWVRHEAVVASLSSANPQQEPK